MYCQLYCPTANSMICRLYCQLYCPLPTFFLPALFSSIFSSLLSALLQRNVFQASTALQALKSGLRSAFPGSQRSCRNAKKYRQELPSISGAEPWSMSSSTVAELHGSLKEGVYYTQAFLGSPRPQNVTLIVDTGSWITEVTCSGCKVCGKHVDPHYDIARSETASWLSCGKGCPGKCSKDKCTFREKYLEGSALEGLWLKDVIRFSDSQRRGGSHAVQTTVGCSFKETGLFASQQQNGILGLAPGSENRPTLMWHMTKKQDHRSRDGRAFILCLRDRGGFLMFGKKRSDKVVPLEVSPQGKYSIKVEGMKVNGKAVETRLGKAQLDSASTLTYLPALAEKLVRKAIEEHCKKNRCGQPPSSSGDEASRSCWRGQGLQKFPVLAWQLQGVEVQWMPSQYLLRQDGFRLCYTFRPTEVLPDGSHVVLGASWMINQELLFDIDGKRLGLTNSSCKIPPALQRKNLRGSHVEREGKPDRRVATSPNSSSTSVQIRQPRTGEALEFLPARSLQDSGRAFPAAAEISEVFLQPETEIWAVRTTAGLILSGACAGLFCLRRRLWSRCLKGCFRTC
eukprot:s1542_g12.t1